MIRKSILALLVGSFSVSAAVMDGVEVLQPLYDEPTYIESGKYADSLYIPSTVDTILWGYLPNKLTPPVAEIDSGDVVVFDTVSHEGILEDQGRDPLKYFGNYGYSEEFVLQDAVDITASDLEHDFLKMAHTLSLGQLRSMALRKAMHSKSIS
ncbi:hypothetical protein ACPV5W_00675 [Vibrio astriarenae]